MAVEITSESFLPMFTQMRQPNGFLSRMFTAKAGSVYYGDKVAIDIQRFGEKIAVAIKKFTGTNLNDFDLFTTKEFKPPTYGEGFTLGSSELINRSPGVDPYSSANIDYSSRMLSKMAEGFVQIDAMIQRAIELQAAQILQTGRLSLIDREGNITYELDFFPKASHFPTVGVDWSAGGNKEQDLLSLSEVIRADGKIDPNMLIFSAESLSQFKNDDSVQKLLDNRRVNIGELAPRFVNSGATFQGFVWIGDYEFQMWSYPETYEHSQTGIVTKYIQPNKVVILSDRTRLDKASAIVPLPISPDPRVASLIPGRLVSREQGFDVTPNVYPNLDGKEIRADLESRTLLLPVQIDGFGCLTTQQ